MAYFPPTGSVVAFQSDPTKLQVTAVTAGSVITVLPANQSVSGTVGASILGAVPVVQSGAWTQSVAGTVFVAGSVAAVLTASTNQSVSGTVGASIVGQLPSGTAMIGSVVAYQGAKPWDVAGSVAATVTNNVTVVSSIAGGIFPIAGSVAAVVTNTVNTAGSVVAFQGTNPWIVNFQNSSILSVPVGSTVTVFQSSSLFAVQQGVNSASVLNSVPSSLLSGVYAQRNDNTSSFLGGNLTWNPLSTDSAGRQITKPFSPEDGAIISYVGSIVSGSVQLIQPSTIGKRSYITDFWLSNTGATTTLVTFQGGDASLVGQFIAPTAGGMSSPGLSIPLKATLAQDLAFKVFPSTSVLYVVIKGYQAP